MASTLSPRVGFTNIPDPALPRSVEFFFTAWGVEPERAPRFARQGRAPDRRNIS